MNRLFLIFVLANIGMAGEGAGPNLAKLVVGSEQCVLAMIDNHLFASGSLVSVSAVSTRTANCPGPVSFDASGMNNPLWLTLQRWEPDSLRSDDTEWLTLSGEPFRLGVGQNIRQQVAQYSNLLDGRYRLLLVNGTEPGPWFYLDSLHFVVGSTSENQQVSLSFAPRFDPEAKTPHIKASRQAYEGKLYFGGTLGYATGFLYQLQVGRMEVLKVEFRQIGSRIVVELPNNSLDGSRPVYASVTADGGGITVQGVVFDPTDPDSNFAGFDASR